MKVLSNLFGTSKKINANDIAIKASNKGICLDEYLYSKFDDTGWIDIPYLSGYTTSVNTEWGRLQGRVISGILYLRGGISPNSGGFALNQDIQVATLPSSLIEKWQIEQSKASVGRAQYSGISVWTINANYGIYLTPLRGVQGSTSAVTWCSTPTSMGPSD